jgi:hypothetical protein
VRPYQGPYSGVKAQTTPGRADVCRLATALELGGIDMATFVFRLIAPRPNFALDMSDEEREIMGRHAAYWQPLIDCG